MKVRIGSDATHDEASAVASALAEHSGERVEVYVGTADDPTVVVEDRDGGQVAPENTESVESKCASGRLDPTDRGPSDREQAIWDELEDIHRGGPEKYRAQLPEANKLFVRDRLELWFGGDNCDFRFEDGSFAAFDAADRLPADGLIIGGATFDGRDVHVMANDYTVKRGSMAEKGVEKFLRMQHRARKTGHPIFYLMDSSGGRIDQQTGFFANREGIGKFYYNHSMLSGWVPQICVLYGPCIAGAAYTPVFADFTIMVEGMSAMAIASPRMVQMVTGEDIDLQELGGPTVHARESGSADLIAKDEQHARELVAKLLTYLPQNADRDPPHQPPRPPAQSPEEIDTIIPSEPSRGYNVIDVIERIVDDESFFELRPAYGSEIVTAFARIDGRAIAIIANQPTQRAGAIFPDSARKAAEFIWTADAFNVPLLYLCDTPGFMAGSQVERDGILEAGKKMIYATSSATVPKLTVLLRKAYGAGIYAMGGPAYDPEGVIALPSGEIAIMGPEAAIQAVYARKLDEIDDPAEREEMERELRESYREDIDVHRMASDVVIDELIPPSTLRTELENRFEFYADVEKSLPRKKHGTIL